MKFKCLCSQFCSTRTFLELVAGLLSFRRKLAIMSYFGRFCCDELSVALKILQSSRESFELVRYDLYFFFFFLTKNKKIIFDVFWPEFLIVNRLRASGLNAILWKDNFFSLLVVPLRMLANVY